MQTRASVTIKNLDFSFENSLVRITANRNFPEVKLARLTVGPFEEGNEYETYYWIAHDLEKSGIVHFREEQLLDTTKLYKIQWKERALTGGQISSVPDDFYPKLRRYIAQLKEEVARTPEKMLDYERVRRLTQDIVNSRLKKVVSLASAPTQTEQTLKNFSGEERSLYEQLCRLIHEWRNQILEFEEKEK